MHSERYLASVARQRAMAKRRAAACAAVAKAVRTGALAPAKTLACTDCGKTAFCYDHRDYSKPLEVDPVCKRCDCLRGSGAPYDGKDSRWAKRMNATAERMVA